MAMKKLKFGWKIIWPHHNKNGGQKNMSVCNKKYSWSINIIFFLHFMKIYAKFIDMSEKIIHLEK